MLTISKPTVFSADGLAARGQCNHDSPGWQLRWFDRETPPVMVWQGAFKTCRHLQMNCAGATTLDEAKKHIDELLATNSLAQFTSQPTDAYPTTQKVDKSGVQGPGQSHQAKKKRRKKKH